MSRARRSCQQRRPAGRAGRTARWRSRDVGRLGSRRSGRGRSDPIGSFAITGHTATSDPRWLVVSADILPPGRGWTMEVDDGVLVIQGGPSTPASSVSSASPPRTPRNRGRWRSPPSRPVPTAKRCAGSARRVGQPGAYGGLRGRAGGDRALAPAPATTAPAEPPTQAATAAASAAPIR